MPSPPLPFDLSGRVAVITGGNRGIGRSIALGMARAGAAVAVLARNEEKNNQVAAEVKALGVPAMALRLDVTARETLSGAIDAVEAALGGIDILVNNAGVASVTGGILEESLEVWDTTIATHLDATFLLSKYAVAVELAACNVQVNAIAPGWITTEMTALARENPDFAEFNKMILARTPAARWGEADEISGAAVFLASASADFITGVTLPVDGGYSIC
jgi:2-dehydro-3-deoxy-D-gluconate 5-dehydrogenase